MNILQQIWTYSTVFSNFLVNLVHAVALVPVIDHDVVAVGETAQFFAVTSVNGGQIAVAVVVVAIWQRSSESCWLSDDLYVNC